MFDFEYQQIRAQNGNWYEYVELFGSYRRGAPGEKRSYITRVTYEEKGEGELVEPFLKLTREAAQTLLDDLWHCGLRPSDGTGSVGQLQATEKHLDDMRKIAFRFVDAMEKR